MWKIEARVCKGNMGRSFGGLWENVDIQNFYAFGYSSCTNCKKSCVWYRNELHPRGRVWPSGKWSGLENIEVSGFESQLRCPICLIPVAGGRWLLLELVEVWKKEKRNIGDNLKRTDNIRNLCNLCIPFSYPLSSVVFPRTWLLRRICNCVVLHRIWTCRYF